MIMINLFEQASILAKISTVLLFFCSDVLSETPSFIMPIAKGLSIEVFENSIVVKTDKKTMPTSELLTNPARYFLDLPEYQIPRPITNTFPNHEKFLAIRAATHKKDKVSFVRIVLDLRSSPPGNPVLSVSPTSIAVDFNQSMLQPASLTPANEEIRLPTPVTFEEKEETEKLTPIPSVTPTKEPAPEAIKTSMPAEQAKAFEEVELRFSVSDLIVNLPHSGRNIRDLTVKNRSESPLFMTALAEQVQNAGQPDEKRAPAKSLLVSPRRFELAPGKERLVRIVVASRDPETEGVFRINFIPDTEPFKEKNISKPIYKAGLSVLAIANPKEPRAVLKDTWLESELILENAGNTNIFLEHGKACKEKQCVALPPKRIYGNSQWIISAKGITSVEFLQKTADDFENIVLKRKDPEPKESEE